MKKEISHWPDCAGTQADQVKETRMQMARMCEATDREVMTAALKFCEWAERLKTDDALKPTVG